jgi:uncharacterized membrane protein YeaQ/YmgE (transglycosylase-associated protein family)
LLRLAARVVYIGSERARRSNDRYLISFAQYPLSPRSIIHSTATWRSDGEDAKMNISGESLLVILAVGIAAGWLAGQIVQGTGLGIVGDLVVGIAGAFIASLIFPQLGIHFGSGIVSEIVEAAIGAILLLLIIMLVRGQSRWGGSWGGVWRKHW